MANSINIYLAGPLFTVAEREFNLKLSQALKVKLNCIIYLPQEYAASVAKDEYLYDKIFVSCIESIKKSDLIIAILEGSDADSGTCVEIGYAFANKKPIIGIRTDFRSSEDSGLNLMVSKSCTYLKWLKNSTTQFDDVVNEIIIAVKKLFPS